MASETTSSVNLFRSLKLIKDDGVVNCQGMVGHILQCILALNCVLKSEQSPLKTTYNILLKEALLFISNLLCNKTSTKVNSNDEMVDSAWLPLHWAVLLCDKVGIKVVQDIYDDDPMALSSQKLHFLSPARILCSKKQCSRVELFLINDFIIRNPNAFTVDNAEGFGVQHSIAECSNDINLLRAIIQLAPNRFLCRSIWDSPLDVLMRERFLESEVWEEMVECLLELDNSPEVVYNAVYLASKI